MHELDAIVLGKAGKDLEQQVRAAAINRLVQECAPLAWQTLLTLMARAQVSWPDPTGLSPHAEAQDVQVARQRELAELEETFLASSLERSANRVFGVVENWKAHYPSPESHPWKRMVLQAVGSGILGYLLSVADAKLRDVASAPGDRGGGAHPGPSRERGRRRRADRGASPAPDGLRRCHGLTLLLHNGGYLL
jgi:hypothetical protein